MVHSNKQLEVSNAGFSGCPHPLPLASNRKGDPRLRSIATPSNQLENHQLAAKGRHRLPSLRSAGDSLFAY